MLLTLPDAGPSTEVLLVHAPYPGKLRFTGVPGSLLAAAARFSGQAADEGSLAVLGLLDPGESSEGFHQALEATLRQGRVRAVCISTSTAAIEETARIAATAKARTPETLVVVGGPHEDACAEKVAARMPAVDLSVSGTAGEALQGVLAAFLRQDGPPAAFLRKLALVGPWSASGETELRSPWWPDGVARFWPQAPRSEARPKPLLLTSKRPRFDVFEAPETLPLMVSQGCPYGRCNFCSEGRSLVRVAVDSDFGWVATLAAARSEAALYFQDSIFPWTVPVRAELLPLLRELERPWGCQVFLPMTTRAMLSDLRAHGCTYIYTGLESASSRVLEGIGKAPLNCTLALDRLSVARDLGLMVGISLMFGALANDGRLLETEQSLRETRRLAESITASGVALAGFYPNIQTVLPGTALARGLARAGYAIDFFRMPRCDSFLNMEDGAIGYNFVTLPGHARDGDRIRLAGQVSRLAAEIETFVRKTER